MHRWELSIFWVLAMQVGRSLALLIQNVRQAQTSGACCCISEKKRPPSQKSAMERSSKSEFQARNSAKICIVWVGGHTHRCHHSSMAAHLENNYFLPLLPFSTLQSSFSLSLSWPVLSRSLWEFVLGADSSCLFFFKWRQTVKSAAVSAIRVLQSKFTGALWSREYRVVNSDLQQDASPAPLNLRPVSQQRECSLLCLQSFFALFSSQHDEEALFN